MDFLGAYLGWLPVSLPLVPRAGPIVTLQDTAKARQGGWPISSLHINYPGNVSWLRPAQPSQKELERKCSWLPMGQTVWLSQALFFSPLRTIITLLMRILLEQTVLACPAPSQI